MRIRFFLIVSVALHLGRCIGPDLGSNAGNLEKNSSCSFCAQQPFLVAPVHSAIVNDTREEIEIELSGAVKCTIDVDGQNNVNMTLKQPDRYAYQPTGVWTKDTVIPWVARCFNHENTGIADKSKDINASFTVSLPSTTISHPPENFISTSFMVYLKAVESSIATGYEFEISRLGSVIATVTSVTNETLTEIPIAEAVFGSFTVRVRYHDVNNQYSNWSAVKTFKVKDRALGTTIYSQDFSALSPCGELAVLIGMNCQDINIFSPPGNCDGRNWFGGGGNVYMCRPSGDSAIRLKLINSNLNTISDITALYENVDNTHVSLEFNGVLMTGSAQNDAMVAVCRHYPIDGNENFAMVYYPRRTGGTTPNIEIRRKEYASGNFEVVASAWRPNTTGAVVYRLDCIGNDITAYYKNPADKFVPLLSVRDSRMPRTPHRIGFAIGQENTIVRMKVFTMNVREILPD